MRRQDPLIIGAGPAGCAAAITLAQGGARPLIVERHHETGDALCGGFISWQTIRRLENLGVDVRGHRINRLRLFAGGHTAEAPLPEPGFGLSRNVMDQALIKAAQAAGAGLERGVTIRHRDEVASHAPALFLATGKYDLKGMERPRNATDPTLGLRVRLPSTPTLSRLIADSIELHLFDRGYAGVELQEDGSANICLAVRKSRLAEAGRDPAALLFQLAQEHPQLGERLAGFSAQLPLDAIAAVPYGWRQTHDPQGVYRLGDQCAVIPSLAGEGNGIALASGVSAARAYLAGQSPAGWQHHFAGATRRPVGLATLLWHLAEHPTPQKLAVRLLGALPFWAGQLARATRITVA